MVKHERLDAFNTAERPDEIAPRRGAGARVDGGRAEAVLDPYSWNVVRFRTRRA